MKKMLFYVAVPVLASAMLSCSGDDDNASNPSGNTAEIVAAMKSGTWQITNFTEDNVNHTDDFAGYTFTFGNASNLVATNGSTTYNGTWSVTEDNSDDDSSDDIDFDIAFTSPADFAELTEDWDIVSRTATKVQLRHISGGDGGLDNLTFEKN